MVVFFPHFQIRILVSAAYVFKEQNARYTWSETCRNNNYKNVCAHRRAYNNIATRYSCGTDREYNIVLLPNIGPKTTAIRVEGSAKEVRRNVFETPRALRAKLGRLSRNNV